MTDTVLITVAGVSIEMSLAATGPRGKSAYQVAVEEGFEGDVSAWLASLDGAAGLSAYEVALTEGFIGTEEEWLESLVGDITPELLQLYADTVTAKTASETARDGSVTARTAAETARDVTLGYRDAAEGHKNGAQTAQAASEIARDGSVTARTATETARDLTLGYRDAAEGHKNGAQTAQAASETARDGSVTARTAAETARDVTLGYRNAAEGFKNDAQAAAAAAASTPVTIIPAATYTLTAATSGHLLIFTANAVVVTLPQQATEAMTAGKVWALKMRGTGNLTWAKQGADVLHVPNSATKIGYRYGVATVALEEVNSGVNTYGINGEISA